MMFEKDELIDQSNNFRTQSLFVEVGGYNEFVLMTLTEHPKEYNGRVLPSLHTIYMEESDLTEYAVAMRVFGSWSHWEKILQNKKILKHIEKYRTELEVKVRSEAVRALVHTASTEGSKGTTAAKYIAEKGWEKRKAGAPSKEEKARELKVQTKITDEVKEDMERLGLH